MKAVQKIKQLLKKGVSNLNMQYSGLELNDIKDHPRVKITDSELQRISKSFKVYGGHYDKVTFKNSYGEEMKRDFYTLNMLKEVSSYLSKIIFNEGCKIETTKEHEKFLKKILKDSNFVKDLSRYLEVAIATGGLVVKPNISSKGKVTFTWCLANTVFPTTVKNTRLQGLAIASKEAQTNGKELTYFTLLEFHEFDEVTNTYTIEHELYQSKLQDKVGKQVPLETLYEGLSKKVTLTGISEPLFSYYTPRGFNNVSPHSPLGLGICDNAMNTLAMINEAYDKFYLDLHTSGRKVIVPDDFIKTNIDFNTGRAKRYFDEDETVFVGLPMGLENTSIKDISNSLRSEDYITAINKAISTLEMQTGLSGGTFTFDKGGLKTATEVVSENSLTYQTRGEQLEEVEHFIKHVIIACFNLARVTVLENGQRAYTGKAPTEEEISVDFQDGVFTDKKAQLEFIEKCLMLNIIPKVEAIVRLFDITEEEAENWLATINSEALAGSVDYQISKEGFSIFGSESEE